MINYLKSNAYLCRVLIKNLNKMLVKLTIESNLKKRGLIGEMVVSTDFIAGAKTVETTKTQFSYPLDPRDRRAALTTLKSTEAIATIKTAFAATWAANYIDLPVIENGVSTTKTFSVSDLVYAIASGTTQCYVYISEGAFVISKNLVDYTLDQLVDIADTGATTTTTTTTTTA